jgi:DmsE family decaheme c-type cytochrome
MRDIRLNPLLPKVIVAICCFLFLSFLAFTAATGQTSDEKQNQTAPTSPPPEATYVGWDTCEGCHADLAAAFKNNPHNSKAFEMKSDKACETCHGPGSAHAEEGNPDLIKSFKRMSASEASETCLGCHNAGMQTHWMGSIHEQRELGCTTCHSIHSAKSTQYLLRTAKVDQQCATCHQDVQAAIQRTSHHPIREGLMSCNDCHNPHGTVTPKMITAISVNVQCYTCHTEKRGPFLWEHPPVKENCLNCHYPHGSNHEKLLVENRPYLCQSCHFDTRHPGTLYDGSSGSQASNREFSRSCSNCHLTIHGSNHPSGWTFLR